MFWVLIKSKRTDDFRSNHDEVAFLHYRMS